MVSRRREAFPSLSSMFAISSFHDGNLHTVHSVRDRTQFSKRLDFENAQTVRGVEILRHRAGLLCRVTKVVKQYYDLNFFVCNYWGVGKVLIHYTFLNLPPPPEYNKRAVPNVQANDEANWRAPLRMESIQNIRRYLLVN